MAHRYKSIVSLAAMYSISFSWSNKSGVIKAMLHTEKTPQHSRTMANSVWISRRHCDVIVP